VSGSATLIVLSNWVTLGQRCLLCERVHGRSPGSPLQDLSTLILVEGLHAKKTPQQRGNSGDGEEHAGRVAPE
jgi:hypothetical protein